MKLDEARSYFLERVGELERMCADGTPWVFLCGCAMIHQFSEIAFPEGMHYREDSFKFKKFIHEYFPDNYREFEYKSGSKDLPSQMYNILFMGMLNHFSVFPEAGNGRPRSILLSHKEQNLSRHSSDSVPDACVLNANAFISDLKLAVRVFFGEVHIEDSMKDRIEQMTTEFPPISANV